MLSMKMEIFTRLLINLCKENLEKKTLFISRNCFKLLKKMIFYQSNSFNSKVKVVKLQICDFCDISKNQFFKIYFI